MARPRLYKYFHITVQPKNCDGTNRNDDYLSATLVRKLDTALVPLSKHFARAIERNKDLIGTHYHISIWLKEKTERKPMTDFVRDIVRECYDLSEQGERKSVVVINKTQKEMKLIAYGYCTKQFETLDGNANYKSDMPDEDFEEYKKEYEELVKRKKETDFSEWVLDTEKKPTSVRNISRYYEIMDIVIQRDNIENVNEFNFHKLIYFHILVNYKITFDYNSIKKFHRQILEYLYQKNDNNIKLSEIGSETLVNFTRFKKQVDFEEIPYGKGFVKSDIREYFEIN